MSKVRFLGLFIAVVSVLVSFGASSASAVTLCKEAKNPCPLGSAYGAGTKMSASLQTGSHLQITTSLGTVTCQSGTMTSTTTNTGSDPIHGTVTANSYTGCTLNGSPCTVVSEHLPWTITISAVNTGNGTQKFEDGGSGKPRKKFTCTGFGFECTSSSEDTFALSGGNPAIATIKQEVKVEGGIFCPATAVFEATYEISSPKPLFISEKP
jgi:hypothetical protein